MLAYKDLWVKVLFTGRVVTSKHEIAETLNTYNIHTYTLLIQSVHQEVIKH